MGPQEVWGFFKIRNNRLRVCADGNNPVEEKVE